MSREYVCAGKAVEAVLKGTSFKKYCSSQPKMGTMDFLLASETIKYQSVLKTLCEGAAVTAKSLDISSTGMLYVYLYELLFGNGKVRGGGQVKRRIAEVLESVKVVLANEMRAQAATHHRELLPANVRMAEESHRQYLRINMLKVEAGGSGTDNHESIMQSIQSQCPRASMDPEIPFLVALPAMWPSFGEHPLVKSGRIIIQDKASCFPSQLLMDEWLQTSGDIIDACAAPGNKTSHLAAIMYASGKHPGTIFAFDKNPNRALLLQDRVKQAGGSNIILTASADFLTLDVLSPMYANVTAILLDPSCSGSGMTKSLDRVAAGSSSSSNSSCDDKGGDRGGDRLAMLRKFQIQALLKSMMFPKVTSIVYSTCSVYEEENESVVAEVIAAVSDWMLKAPPRFNHWKRRGLPYTGLSPAESACLIRSSPVEGTIGFFLALFTRDLLTRDAATKKVQRDAEAFLPKKKPKGASHTAT